MDEDRFVEVGCFVSVEGFIFVVDLIFSVDVSGIVECVISCVVEYGVDVNDTVESGVVTIGTVECGDVVCDADE